MRNDKLAPRRATGPHQEQQEAAGAPPLDQASAVTAGPEAWRLSVCLLGPGHVNIPLFLARARVLRTRMWTWTNASPEGLDANAWVLEDPSPPPRGQPPLLTPLDQRLIETDSSHVRQNHGAAASAHVLGTTSRTGTSAGGGAQEVRGPNRLQVA